MPSSHAKRHDRVRSAASGERLAETATFDWTYPLLAIAILVHVYLCWRLRTPLAYDARFAYLPLAHRLLSEGWAFLEAEQSIWVPFGAYAYPALLDVDVQAIAAVNVVMSCSVVLMLYRIASRAHSVRAGLISAWLYAASPTIAPLVINVLTEVPFLFLCALWLWAFTELCDSGQRRWAWLAGLALGCAVNMRASLVPFVYASLLVSILAAKRADTGRDPWRKLAAVQAIAAVLPTLVIAKNWWLFDLPQISTGGGNAFYLGSDPLTGGYEPAYGGLFFDVGTIAQGDHLSVRADRTLRAAGWVMLQANPLEHTLANYARRLSAFLFYPNVLLNDSLFTLRSLRICLVAGAAVAMVRGWRRPALIVAASVAAFQVVVHMPLLYDPRYSEGALDLWLALLAGCGFATVSRWSMRGVLLFAFALAAACYAGKTIRHLEGRVAPLHFNAGVAHRIVWEQRTVPDAALTGLEADRGAGALVATAERPSVRLPLPVVERIAGNAKHSRRNLFLILDVWTPADGKRCGKGRIDFRSGDAPAGKPAPDAWYPFRLKRDSAVQTFAFGVAAPTPTWQAPVDGPGTFTIEFSCDAGGLVRLERLAIAESTFAAVYGHERTTPPSAATLEVIEYYNRSLDHYFITWDPAEIAALDASVEPDRWTRTGQSFKAYASSQYDTSPMCRFYGPSDLGNSHFFGLGRAECDAIQAKSPKVVLEAAEFMHMLRPLHGQCPAGTTPVYRAFNKTANHRYVTDKAIRDRMEARGWRVEGEGPDRVAMCAPQ